MLDDQNLIKQRDPDSALQIAASQCEQANFIAELINAENDHRDIKNIVIAGMGGSALAAVLAKVWLRGQLKIPMEVVRTYDLPNYVGHDSLVIASSYSGNTEETVSCLEKAMARDAQVAIIAAGGRLIEIAEKEQITYTQLIGGLQPRVAMIYNLCALVQLLENFKVVEDGKLSEIASTAEWLKDECKKWTADVPTDQNYAKLLALEAVGKTAVFYGGALTMPIAYKWKISWNENAKNVAFWNELPEFNHNEFMGWTSHPVEKPFAVFDIVSSFEHPQILKRFEVSDRLLSGMRPKSTTINLQGDSPIAQMLWGCILSDFTSIYLAILNNVNPTPVPLIEKLKKELA